MDLIKDSNVFLYCMFCGEKFRGSKLKVHNGAFDVCTSEKCLKDYKKTKKVEKDRAKNRKWKEKIDASWMTGD